MNQDRIKELFILKGNGLLVWLKPATNRVSIGQVAGYVCGNGCGNSYRRIKIGSKSYYAHHLIWMYVHGYMPDQIDHIDGNGLNNNISNLRLATASINNKNARRRLDNTSGCTGVYWNKNKDKWYSEICSDGVRTSLGYFTEWFDAVCTRKAAEYRLGFHPNHGRCLEQLCK